MKLSAANHGQIQETRRSERNFARLLKRRRVLQFVSVAAVLAAAGCKTKISPPDFGRYDRVNPGP